MISKREFPKDWLRVTAALAITAWAVACGSQPAPRIAFGGTTISIAVDGDKRSWPTAYGGLLTGEDQRGSIVFELVDGPGAPIPLVTRFMTRVMADPASRIGLDDFIPSDTGSPGGWGGFLGSYQTIALLDVPCGPNGHYSIAMRHERRTGPEVEDVETTPPYFIGGPLFQRIEVETRQDCTELFTELTAAQLGLALPSAHELAAAVPLPRMLLKIPRSHAGTLVLSYPEAKLSVEGILVDDMVGQKAVVMHAAPEGDNRVRIEFASPRRSVSQLALVFEPHQEDYWVDPIVGEDFTVLLAAFYDAEGGDITPDDPDWDAQGIVTGEIR